MVSERGGQRSGPPLAWVRVDHVVELAQVEELEDLGLVERSLERAARQRGGEVEEGSGGGGDSNAVVAPCLVAS